jgi:hypothetical protein
VIRALPWCDSSFLVMLPSTYLRPIAEDQSDTSSLPPSQRLPLSTSSTIGPRVFSDCGSSTCAVEAGRAGSVLSDSAVSDAANLAGQHPDDDKEGTDRVRQSRRPYKTRGSGSSQAPESSRDSSSGARRRRLQREREAQHKPWQWLTHRSTLLSVGLLVMVAVGIGLLVGLGVGQGSSDNEMSAASGSGGTTDMASSTPAPTPLRGGPSAPAPTVDPRTVAQLDAVFRRVSDPALFNVPDSPQSQARNWMLTGDLLREDVLADGVDHVAQRYVIALLFYATDGPSSWAHADFLSNDEMECEWRGVHCDAITNVVDRLRFPGWNLTGSLPSELMHLTFLQELDLSDNRLVGTLPVPWFPTSTTLATDVPFPDLYWLDVSSNTLDGTLPHGVWNMPTLRFLYAHGNQLSGNIDRHGNLPSSPYLEDIRLDENLLTGPLPSWLPELSSLNIWISNSNSLSGNLPDLSNLVNLTFWDASFNNFTGRLEESWLYGMPALTKLFLDHNALTGVLPAPTAGLRNTVMAKLWLQGNQLAGPFPENFGRDWPNLLELLLQDNELTGVVDACIDRQTIWPRLQRLETDCLVRNNVTTNETGPEVQCSCCTSCYTETLA